jgi:hypothetical protein
LLAQVKASYKLGEALKKPKKAAKKPTANKPAAKKPAAKKTPKKKAEGECSSAGYGVTTFGGAAAAMAQLQNPLCCCVRCCTSVACSGLVRSSDSELMECDAMHACIAGVMQQHGLDDLRHA